MQDFRKKRTHKIVAKDHSRVMRLGNGQLIATVPREIARWKHIDKATLLKWSDAGANRVLIEVVVEPQPDNAPESK